MAISVITQGELLYGALNKLELNRLQRSLKRIKILPVNEAISRLHIALLETYVLSHKLDVPDALIAATAIHHNCPLYTVNLKDFRYIDALALYQPK